MASTGGGGGLRHSNSSRLSRMSFSGGGSDDARAQAAAAPGGDRPMVTFARRTRSGRYVSYSRDDLDSELGAAGVDMSPDRDEQLASYHIQISASR